MLRTAILVAVSALVPAVASAQSIEGVWRLTGGETISLPENQPLERQIVTLTRNELVTALTNEAGVTTTLSYERVE